MTQERSVEELVRRAQGKDREAFAELSDLYRRRVEALALSRMAPALRRRISVEDVVQETMARAFESVDKFQWRGEESFLRWLGTISRNVIARAAREKGKHLDLDLLRTVPASGTSPSAAARRDERFNRLEEALRQLTPDQREAIRLSRIEGLKIREVAERMGKKEDAVQQLIVRGLRSLKRNFGDTESLHLPDKALEFGDRTPGEDRAGDR